MNETEKMEIKNLQQELDTLKRQQELILEQFIKIISLFGELLKMMSIETKKDIILCQQEMIKQLKQKQGK
jgi:hypothetical protein